MLDGYSAKWTTENKEQQDEPERTMTSKGGSSGLDDESKDGGDGGDDENDENDEDKETGTATADQDSESRQATHERLVGSGQSRIFASNGSVVRSKWH
jgi:hypothetical protein